MCDVTGEPTVHLWYNGTMEHKVTRLNAPSLQAISSGSFDEAVDDMVTLYQLNIRHHRLARKDATYVVVDDAGVIKAQMASTYFDRVKSSDDLR